MLIIVENGNIADFLKALFNLKASGSTNIFQINTSKGASQKADCLNNIIWIFAPDTKRNGINVPESLEKDTLSLHNWHSRFRSDISKTQNRCSVSYNRDCIPSSGQVEAFLWMFLNFKARSCNARCICK